VPPFLYTVQAFLPRGEYRLSFRVSEDAGGRLSICAPRLLQLQRASFAKMPGITISLVTPLTPRTPKARLVPNSRSTMLAAFPLSVTIPPVVSVRELSRRCERSDSLTMRVMAASSSFSSCLSDADKGAVLQNKMAPATMKNENRRFVASLHEVPGGVMECGVISIDLGACTEPPPWGVHLLLCVKERVHLEPTRAWTVPK
jgi:hypothetical protein